MSDIWTIGYETATPATLVAALQWSRVDLLVDVRAVAASRRPGFAKRSLEAGVTAVGIGYLHLRGLGTPADGRLAARAGRHDDMRRIYDEHLTTTVAVADLARLADLVAGGRRVCLLCLEREPHHCHRSIIGERLRDELGATTHHLAP